MLRTSRHDIDLILHASFNVSHRCSIFTYIFIDVHVLDINQFMGIFLYPAVLIILDQVYRILKYAVTNFRKKIRTITGGPWWTQIKVVLIQKGLLDNQNPGFCMGWPGLYLLDNIDQLGSLINDAKNRKISSNSIPEMLPMDDKASKT